jgi:hypothetical protein
MSTSPTRSTGAIKGKQHDPEPDHHSCQALVNRNRRLTGSCALRPRSQGGLGVRRRGGVGRRQRGSSGTPRCQRGESSRTTVSSWPLHLLDLRLDPANWAFTWCASSTLLRLSRNSDAVARGLQIAQPRWCSTTRRSRPALRRPSRRARGSTRPRASADGIRELIHRMAKVMLA